MVETVLALVAMTALPPADDIYRLPDEGLTRQQAFICEEHVRRLKFYRAVHGYCDGAYDLALEETGRRLEYWRQVDLCYRCCYEDAILPLCLERLRDMIGQARYYRKDGIWSPVCLPAEGPLPDFPGRVPPPPAPEAPANANNGATLP